MKAKRRTKSEKWAAAGLDALRRAAKKAVELGRQTGTPAYVERNGKIVDAAKQARTSKRTRSEA